MSLANIDEWLQDFLDIQVDIMNANVDDLEATVNFIRDSYIVQSNDDLQSLVENFVLAAKCRTVKIPIIASLLNGVRESLGERGDILVHFAFKMLFPKRTSTFERSRLAFIRELYEVNFFTLEKIKQGFERLNRGVNDVRKDIVNESASNDIHMYLFGLAIYFGPVLEENAPEIWAEIMEALDWFKDKSTRDLKKLVTELENAKKNNWELWRQHFDKEFGQQTLRGAISRDDDELMGLILSRGSESVDQHLPDMILEPCDALQNGPTLIQTCAYYGAVKCFKYLLLHEVNLAQKDRVGRTVQQFAILGGSLQIVRLLEQQSLSLDQTIDNAIEMHQMEIFEWLDEQEPIEHVEPHLMTAVMCNNIAVLVHYKEKGVDLGRYAVRLLKQAYVQGYKETIFCLLHEVLVNELPFYVIDVDECLRVGAGEARLDCIKALVENFENDPNTASDGWPALHTAARDGRLGLVKYLTTIPDIDINYSTSSAGTALHQAAKKGRVKILQHLLSCPGINVNAVDSRFRTPLHIAAEWKQFEIAKILLNTPGIDIYAEDGVSFTFIMEPCFLTPLLSSRHLTSSILCSMTLLSTSIISVIMVFLLHLYDPSSHGASHRKPRSCYETAAPGRCRSYYAYV